MDEPHIFSAVDLHQGLKAEFEREIAEADVAAFADLSGDWNPLHMQESYAARTNYGGRIVHGAFQVGLASAMAGMHLPGRDVVVGSLLSRFPAPLRYPSRVKVQGEITTWLPELAKGTLQVRVIELPTLALTADIQVGFTLHEGRAAVESRKSHAAVSTGEKPAVLITGASGGLGQAIAQGLSAAYHVVGLTRSAPTPPPPSDDIEWLQADLNASNWEKILEGELAGRALHGIVHAAWPIGPQAGLLDADLDAVSAQVEFASTITIRLARFLRSRAAGSGRMVIFGSTAGTLKPVLNMGPYSLGKATLEHTVRLLAPELARSGITINLVLPSFVHVGMNNAKTGRVVLAEAAKVPLGRVCSPEDVCHAVEFFLSAGAEFVTGQLLPLTGGRL